jgi:hypothetical protein
VKIISTIALVGICVSGRAAAQPAQPTVASLLKKLNANQWEERDEAVQRLTEAPEMLRSPVIKRALIQLLDRENKRLRAPRPQSRQTAANDDHENDENYAYATYHSMLLGLADSLIDPGDEPRVAILVDSVYNPDSDFALKLASYGQTVVRPLLKIAVDPNPERRPDALEVLGRVLRNHRLGTCRYPLTLASVRDIEDRLRTGLRDPLSYVRLGAIQGVKAAGDVPSLPILEEIRTSDPYQSEPGHYLLRQFASKAIAEIKAHPLDK